jgi:glucose/arabinose dehydrogenase
VIPSDARACLLRLALLLTLAGLGAVSAARGAPRVETVLRHLEVPWALAFAPGGRLFFTERPGRLRVVTDGKLAAEPVARLPVSAVGEGGLMGLALDPDFGRTQHLYVCYTAAKRGGSVNRISRLTLSEGRAADERVLLDDMPASGIHDGCRLKFGPDRKLYATMGDAGESSRAQQRDSLSGKILRINADGAVPGDNPFRGSPVWSFGHRNPQGLAWDTAGRMWESEHGSTAHDEINLIQPGRNYGWPEVRGRETRDGFVSPMLESSDDTWAPSGIAILHQTLYVAGLRGQRLLKIAIAGGKVGDATTLLKGEYGRLRDVVVGPDGALWVATSNRDGRGSPHADDDRMLKVVP